MSESNGTKKNKTIAFRLAEEEYALAENAAKSAGDDTNNWVRNVVLAQANAGPVMTKNQRLIYEELARVRYLVGNGFRILFGPQPATAVTWKKLTADADQTSDIIAANLMSRRKITCVKHNRVCKRQRLADAHDNKKSEFRLCSHMAMVNCAHHPSQSECERTRAGKKGASYGGTDNQTWRQQMAREGL